MVHDRKKKALYELVGRSGIDPAASTGLKSPPPTASGSTKYSSGRQRQMMRWPRRPRMLQINAGRIEISVPYQLAIAVVMVLILLFLMVFRLGENSAQSQADISVVDLSKSIEEQMQQPAPVAQKPTGAENAPPARQKKEPVKSTGSNRIVIQTYPLRAHLEPVKQYFAEYGIETEIRKIGDRYFLITSDKYQNPERPGTDGFAAKQKIIELGANYKAPPRRETFGTRPFHDAYGMKFDD